MTCHFLKTPTFVIVVCTNIEESYHASLAVESEANWRENQHEMDLQDVEDIQHIEVEFCRQRVDTDPYYEENWYEECEPDPALVAINNPEQEAANA